ncbi:MAG TPA: hydroxymethylbilane synthase [Saprospiraceae bacterium]|nr:hydroxymethylbilane synthase [Saprospiraceae bacterium]HMP24695.1 hydroxymethylbilane synthase [Saprospiraceae bacterium]
MSRTIRIGTRGSRLALWQAEFTRQQLAAVGVASELTIIKTKGDQIQHLGFDKIEGKGFFTKEIEDALLRGDIDMAVHSMKDLPTTQPQGLAITAVSYRENPADWLIVRPTAMQEGQLFQLKKGAIVGTSSARRKAQLLDFRPDIILNDIRGNVPTRLDKLRQGNFDAIMLAGAGLSRLEIDLSEWHTVQFNPREFVPAPAQGVLAFQTTKDDLPLRRILQQIHHPEVSAVTNVERKVLKLMGGGCHMPIGVYCERDAAGNYHVWAAVADVWDAPLRRAHLSSSTHFNLAERMVEQLQRTSVNQPL